MNSEILATKLGTVLNDKVVVYENGKCVCAWKETENRLLSFRGIDGDSPIGGETITTPINDYQVIAFRKRSSNKCMNWLDRNILEFWPEYPSLTKEEINEILDKTRNIFEKNRFQKPFDISFDSITHILFQMQKEGAITMAECLKNFNLIIQMMKENGVSDTEGLKSRTFEKEYGYSIEKDK